MTSVRGLEPRAAGAAAAALSAGSCWTAVGIVVALVLSGCDGGGAPASAPADDYHDKTRELVAEARRSGVRHAGGVEYTLNDDGLAVALTAACAPRSRREVFSQWTMPRRSHGRYGYLTFMVDEGPYAIALLDEERNLLVEVRGSRPPASPRALAFPRGARPDSIVFYYPGETAGEIHYSSIRLWLRQQSGEPPASWGPWLDVGEAAKKRIIEPTRRRWSSPSADFDELVEHFQSTAAWLRRDARQGAHGEGAAGELNAEHLRQDLESARELLARAHGVRDATRQELLYVCYAAHFAVDFTTGDGTEATEVLARGDGTCWQQAVVAAALGNALRPGKYRRVVTDAEQMGHTVTVAPEGIIDATTNAVLFVDPETWCGWPAWRRLQAMEEDARFGIYRGFHQQLAGVSWSALGEAMVRRTYTEFIQLWPRTEVVLPAGWR